VNVGRMSRESINKGTSIAPMVRSVLQYMDKNGIHNLKIDFNQKNNKIKVNQPY
jgi:hypothetical protein